jgi:hypothetical protein
MATADEVVGWLERFAHSFNFTRPGLDQSLGRDMAMAQIQRILDRCAQFVGPDGTPWEENSDTPTPWMPNGYKQWKADHYGWDHPNYRTGQMLSKASMAGNIEITADEVKIGYGLGLPPRAGYSPTGHCSDEDRAVTDREKAEWAHMETRHRRARPFFGVGEGDAEAVQKVAFENLSTYLDSAH